MLKIGILKQMRGNNFKDKEIGKKIKNLWCEALKELELQDKTTLKENILYGIYTEYESNYKGDYIFFIGGDKIVSKEELIIEEENYHIFQVENSEENGVPLTWEKIWNLERNKKLKRAYTVDYEKYYPDGKIEIYISVK